MQQLGFSELKGGKQRKSRIEGKPRKSSKSSKSSKHRKGSNSRVRRGGNDIIVPSALAAYGIWHKYRKGRTTHKGKGKGKRKTRRRSSLLPKIF